LNNKVLIIINLYKTVNMNLEEFNRAARILGRKHVPNLLKELKKKNWLKATEVSSYIGITPATAVSYLKDLESLDVLEKREIKGETGPVWEYRLPSETISIETKITE